MGEGVTFEQRTRQGEELEYSWMWGAEDGDGGDG